MSREDAEEHVIARYRAGYVICGMASLLLVQKIEQNFQNKYTERGQALSMESPLWFLAYSQSGRAVLTRNKGLGPEEEMLFQLRAERQAERAAGREFCCEQPWERYGEPRQRPAARTAGPDPRHKSTSLYRRSPNPGNHRFCFYMSVGNGGSTCAIPIVLPDVFPCKWVGQQLKNRRPDPFGSQVRFIAIQGVNREISSSIVRPRSTSPSYC